MGKKAVLLEFWFVGFLLGIFAWYMKEPALKFIENIGLTEGLSEGILAGFVGSGVMVLIVLAWSSLSSS